MLRALQLGALLGLGHGYECDPGISNRTARALCVGWLPGRDTNRSKCEIELGCCWALGAAAPAACYSPVGSAGPGGRLPHIDNKELQWLGFFGQPDRDAYRPNAQHGIASFGSSSDLPTLARGAALGMAGLFKTQLYLVRKGNYHGPVEARGHRLFPDWRQRWSALAHKLAPWVANSTIRGFHIGDELCWGGLPYTEMVGMAAAIAETQWPGLPRMDGQADNLSLIVYANEGAGTLVRDRNCFNLSIGYTSVPAGLTWISFDFYNPPASWIRGLYEQHLYPKMLPHQRVLLVPDASTSAFVKPGNANHSGSGWSVPDMVGRAHEYFAWAATDTSGKIIGMNPWHWNTVPFTPGDYWELGIESIPPLTQVWTAIGQAVLANGQAHQRG